MNYNKIVNPRELIGATVIEAGNDYIVLLLKNGKTATCKATRYWLCADACEPCDLLCTYD